MSFEQDTPRATFLKEWPGRYVETWDAFRNAGYKETADDVLRVVDKFARPEMQALEIGIGAGWWTRRLLEKFSHVTGLDLHDSPPFEHPKFTYLPVPDRDFTCGPVPDNSIDFVFSFGVFCHLTCEAQTAYLKALHRVLKPSGAGVVLFANGERHPEFLFNENYANRRVPEVKPGDSALWFCNNLATTRVMLNQAGLADFVDEMPNFRDTIGSFRKP